jgi:hypothetical protein
MSRETAAFESGLLFSHIAEMVGCRHAGVGRSLRWTIKRPHHAAVRVFV